MTCQHPQTVFQAYKGAPIQWRPPRLEDRRDYNPMFAKEPVRVFEKPCGQCQACRARKAMDWTTRLVHEHKLFKPHECHFVTFTYDDEHIPANGSVRLDELQKLLKRIRQYADRQLAPGLGKQHMKIRYFAAGEYGEESKRCHYHAILYGLELPDLTPAGHGRAQQDTLYESAALDACWQNRGMVRVGKVTKESIAYCARYCMKKLSDGSPEQAAAYGEQEFTHPRTGEILSLDLAPEFATMSRGRRANGSGGIGYGWFQRYAMDAFPSDFVIIDGKKRPVPDYYLSLTDPATQELIKAARAERGLAAAMREVDAGMPTKQIGDAVQLTNEGYEERYRKVKLGDTIDRNVIARAKLEAGILARRRATKVEILKINTDRAKRTLTDG